MTLGEGKKKVYELLDEYSSGGELTEDKDIELKLADFFDIAQKRVAMVKRIVAVKTINRTAGKTEYSMPGELRRAVPRVARREGHGEIPLEGKQDRDPRAGRGRDD